MKAREAGNLANSNKEAFQRVSSATGHKADQGKASKVEKRAYYGTREEWVTGMKNEEQEAVDCQIEHNT